MSLSCPSEISARLCTVFARMSGSFDRVERARAPFSHKLFPSTSRTGTTTYLWQRRTLQNVPGYLARPRLSERKRASATEM